MFQQTRSPPHLGSSKWDGETDSAEWDCSLVSGDALPLMINKRIHCCVASCLQLFDLNIFGAVAQWWMALDILKSDWWMTHVSKNPLNLLFCVKIVSARCHLEGDDACSLAVDGLFTEEGVLVTLHPDDAIFVFLNLQFNIISQSMTMRQMIISKYLKTFSNIQIFGYKIYPTKYLKTFSYQISRTRATQFNCISHQIFPLARFPPTLSPASPFPARK